MEDGSNTARLSDQTVVVVGGSAGIGLETARYARAAAAELNVQHTEIVDADDPDALLRLFGNISAPIDHVMVTAGSPHYGPPLDMAPEDARRGFAGHLMLALNVVRCATAKMRPLGSITFMGGTGGRRPRPGFSIVSTATMALPTLIANLAIEVSPVRINLIAAGFVDTPLSARLLGSDLERRREELRATNLIRRVVIPSDVAALAIHLMTNDALTGATFDIDGGQQLVT